MSDHCDVCGQDFLPLFIKVEMPVVEKGVVKTYHLCRTCFLEADSQGREWKPPKGEEVPAK